MSIPGAFMVDGGRDILVDSGLRRAWCAEELKAQFLYVYQTCWGLRLDLIEWAYFRVEATPPLRMVSLCSVNATSFARGYSRSSFGRVALADRGVKKKERPVGAYNYNIGVNTEWCLDE